MNIRTLGIIIRREYLNKVKKKSFLIITFVVPILFAALCIVPSVIMLKAKEGTKKVAVVDRSGIVVGALQNSDVIEYVDYSSFEIDSVKSHLSDENDLGYDAVLSISPLDSAAKTVSADVYSSKPLGVDSAERLKDDINEVIENYRIEQTSVPNLKTLMKEVKSNISVNAYVIDEEGKENVSKTEIVSIVSFILGMLIYLFVTLFSGMVMGSVIEEKSSRVVEVLISSVKASELMFGKIIGVALVALTQFLLWVVLTFSLVGVAGSIMGQDLLASASDTQQITQMAGMNMGDVASISADQGDFSTILDGLKTLPLGTILLCFFVYFIFGYILYATVFAAIGSSGENEADTQQLQLPVTLPLVLGFFIAIVAMKAPDSPIVFWGSIIPFTSPTVMLARIPYGVAPWELILSIALLVGTSVLFAWLSAKIYKVGILMFGKKSTWKDLWKWLKQK